jgi:hypothetical protein
MLMPLPFIFSRTVINLDGVCSVLQLLKERHFQLYNDVQELLTFARLPTRNMPDPPAPPVITFPGRLSAQYVTLLDNYNVGSEIP